MRHPSTCVTVADAQKFLSTVAIDELSVRDLYQQSCEHWGRPVNAQVKNTLCGRLGGYDSVTTIDLNDCYIASKGFGVLMPIFLVCERLRTARLGCNGLKRPELLLFLKLATRHPSLETIYLQGNELGTTGGQSCLKMVETNHKITELNVQDCLVIDGLQRKIRKQTEHNKKIAHNLPLRPYAYVNTAQQQGQVPMLKNQNVSHDSDSAHDVSVETAATKDLGYWVLPAMSELTELLAVHKAHVNDLNSLFCTPCECSPVEFKRVMKILGCRFLEEAEGSETRGEDLANLLGCYSKDSGTIHYKKIIEMLRVRVVFLDPEGCPVLASSRSAQAAMNLIYDRRESLLDSFQAIELEAGRVAFFEFHTGLVSLIGEALLASVLPLFDIESSMVQYKSFLSRLTPSDAPCVDWERLSMADAQAAIDAVKQQD
eukprot:TRINITY_DN31371_c0_g1_i1.p1 TRINITY_DN31371_c0_g1~~TRINITY_DN31371_c0_g1_i1.p1  ORF type:complete len:429 (+),score=57.29 TRINITY_DN31371_c0_g1_i1:36-1322(+)